MLLHCTLAGRAGSVVGRPVELSVELPAGCSGALLEEAVAREFGTGSLLVAGTPLCGLAAGTAPLVNGAVLTDGRSVLTEKRSRHTEERSGHSEERSGHPERGRTEPLAALLLAVLSGPGAGMMLPLRRGACRIGRSGTDLAIPDADLSRDHARLEVSDSGITLVDRGSANGTLVDGRPVTSAPVSTASLIRCGNSTLGILLPAVFPEEPGLEAAGGDISEPLRVAGTGAAVQRALLVLAAVLPLAAGVGVAAVTGMWMFLAFSAFSAVPLLLPALSGHRQRRELRDRIAAAARSDAERRRRAAPSAAVLVLDAASPGRRDWEAGRALEVRAGEPARAVPGPVWLRLGLAEQAANVMLEPSGSGFRAPPGGHLPVTLDPAQPAFLDGSPQAVAGLVRFCVMQLAAYPRASRTWVHLHGPARSVPLPARFLARVSLSTSPAAAAARLAAGPGPGCDRGVLILLPGAEPAGSLRAEASRLGWQLIDCARDTAAAGPAQSLTVHGRTGRFTRGPDTLDVVPDLVPERVFDRFCRQPRNVGDPLRSPSAVPASCSLAELLPLSEAEVSRRWASVARSADRPLELAVPVGHGPAGPLRIDLQSDGPHFLVAGTTGSGKSEFLRTLVTGLAASYPPDRVNFLFVDFKGGSGLGPLTGLPHCVGLLTDLDQYEVDRTLASLRAEVRHREELLAGAGVADLAGYRARGAGLPALPSLVLVIDEFRMLVEDAPAALAELIRVAVIGRSLGIHLVMATQRPQGALTADIRANVTSCVVLRVQSALESTDIMNSRLAAAIPIHYPGRAYLVRGGGAPEEFQTASLSGLTPDRAADTVTVMPAEALLERPFTPLPSAAGGCGAGPVDAAAPFVELAGRLWRLQGGAPARRPVAAPLPPAAALPRPEEGPRAGGSCSRGIPLGVVDLPEQQRLGRLVWNPGRHGHLALLGGTQSPAAAGGPAQTVLLVVEQLVRAEAESHLYLLDADGSLADFAPFPRVGACVGPGELQRAARVLTRISEEMAARLAVSACRNPPLVVLVLHNWGRWVSAFRAGPHAGAEDLVHDIVRDGPKAGITAVFTGERELVTSRFFAGLANRMYFPAGSTEESRLAWPPMPRVPEIPGRVLVTGPYGDGEVPGTGTPGQGGAPGTGGAAGATAYRAVPRAAQLYRRSTAAAGSRPVRRRQSGGTQTRPFRVEALPALATVQDVRYLLQAASREDAGRDDALREDRPHPPGRPGHGRLWIGLGGDELLPAGIVLPPGGVLAVLGGPGSGKSTLLRTLPQLNPSAAWLRPGAGISSDAYWEGIHAQAVAGQLDRAAVVLADDADLQPREENDKLHQLNGLGWTVVFTAGYSPALQHRVPLALSARSHGKAILIQPRNPMDADLFGVRFEPERHPPPGRAVVISDARATAVQLALASESTEPGVPRPRGKRRR